MPEDAAPLPIDKTAETTAAPDQPITTDSQTLFTPNLLPPPGSEPAHGSDSLKPDRGFIASEPEEEQSLFDLERKSEACEDYLGRGFLWAQFKVNDTYSTTEARYDPKAANMYFTVFSK